MSRGLGSRVLVVVYILGVAAFFEIAARGALAIPAVFKRVSGTCDAAWRLQWVRRGHHNGGAYPFDVYHPTRGWALRPSLRGWRAFGEKVLNSNSKGLRGRREYEQEKVPGCTRIEVFGDSFTFGEDVADDETYVAQLQRLLWPRAEVMNFGVHGYGNDQMLLYLEEEGLSYHPDVVILGFVDWDMERNLLGFRDFAKPWFDVVDGRLVLRNSRIPSPREVLAAEPYRSRFFDLLTMVGHGVRWRLGWCETDSERVTAALFDAFRERVEAAGAKLVIAYLPVETEIDPQAGAATEGETFVARYCGERHLPPIDVRPAFVSQERQGVRLKVRGHWNAREHRLAAQAIKAGLANMRLVP